MVCLQLYSMEWEGSSTALELYNNCVFFKCSFKEESNETNDKNQADLSFLKEIVNSSQRSGVVRIMVEIQVYIMDSFVKVR